MRFVVIFALFISLTLHGMADQPLQVGDEAPDLSNALNWLHGTPHRAWEPGSSYLVVAAPPSWCPPCAKFVRTLNDDGISFFARGLNVIFITHGESGDSNNVLEPYRRIVASIASPSPISDRISVCEVKENGPWIPLMEQVEAVPWAFLVGGDGKIVFCGYTGNEEFDADLLLALNGALPASRRLDLQPILPPGELAWTDTLFESARKIQLLPGLETLTIETSLSGKTKAADILGVTEPVEIFNRMKDAGCIGPLRKIYGFEDYPICTQYFTIKGAFLAISGVPFQIEIRFEPVEALLLEPAGWKKISDSIDLYMPLLLARVLFTSDSPTGLDNWPKIVNAAQDRYQKDMPFNTADQSGGTMYREIEGRLAKSRNKGRREWFAWNDGDNHRFWMAADIGDDLFSACLAYDNTSVRDFLKAKYQEFYKQTQAQRADAELQAQKAEDAERTEAVPDVTNEVFR